MTRLLFFSGSIGSLEKRNQFQGRQNLYAARSFEVAAPIPRLPPVTNAVLPANDPDLPLFINHLSYSIPVFINVTNQSIVHFEYLIFGNMSSSDKVSFPSKIISI